MKIKEKKGDLLSITFDTQNACLEDMFQGQPIYHKRAKLKKQINLLAELTVAR
jgi:hypothetical protein